MLKTNQQTNLFENHIVDVATQILSIWAKHLPGTLQQGDIRTSERIPGIKGAEFG